MRLVRGKKYVWKILWEKKNIDIKHFVLVVVIVVSFRLGDSWREHECTCLVIREKFMGQILP